MLHLVLIDLDGTLLNGPSSERRFILHLLGKGCIGLYQLWQAAVFTKRWFGRFGMEVFKKNKAYLAKLPEDRIQNIAKDFVQRDLVAHLSPVMRLRIDEHRSRGDLTALLTGSLACIAEPIAELVGIEQCLATRCPMVDGCYSNAPPDQHPYGIEKLRLAEAFCQRTDTRLDDCTAYGNAAADIPILQAVSHPVVVGGNKRLRQYAAAKGWSVLSKSAVDGKSFHRNKEVTHADL